MNPALRTATCRPTCEPAESWASEISTAGRASRLRDELWAWRAFRVSRASWLSPAYAASRPYNGFLGEVGGARRT